MTAVDHAELKRLEAELVQMLAPDQGESAHPAFGHAVRIQNAHTALLSEIEGLKAEREGLINAAEARNSLLEITERQLADLRTQAPDSWRPDREEIFAAMSTGILPKKMRADCPVLYYASDVVDEPVLGVMADAVFVALRSQTAESGK